MLGCKGLPTAIQRLRGAEQRGHKLGVSMIQDETSLPLVFCLKCGAYSSKICVRLAGDCPPEISKSGEQTLYRIVDAPRIPTSPSRNDAQAS